MIATLEHERDQMTRRIEVLIRNRDAISEYLEAVLEGDRSKAIARDADSAAVSI